MNFNANVGVNVLYPSQKSVLSDDISWDTWNDKSVNTDNAATYTSGNIHFEVNLLDSNGDAINYNGNVTYNTSKDQTLTDLATAIAAKAKILSCAYVGSSTHTITTIAKPGYRIVDVTLTPVTSFGGTGLTFTEVLSGGIWWVTHKDSILEVSHGIITTSSGSFCILPRQGKAQSIGGKAGLLEFRTVTLTASNNLPFPYLYTAILKTHTASGILAAGASQILL